VQTKVREIISELIHPL
jgi:hypothetical protein